MKENYIESLEIEYNGELIISDIDDCLINTSGSLILLGIDRFQFWFDKTIYDKNKHNVLINASLTPWGKELIKGIKIEKFKDVILISAAIERVDIIREVMKTDVKLIEGLKKDERTNFLNTISQPCIYVDDKNDCCVNNINIHKIIYPTLRFRRSKGTVKIR